jgi:hypothetical protein
VILETFEPSLFSLNDIDVRINPTSNLELLETLSNKAKKVTIEVREENKKLTKEEFHANFQSVTEHLTIIAWSEIILPLQMVNIFLNIKSLDLMRVNNFQKIT